MLSIARNGTRIAPSRCAVVLGNAGGPDDVYVLIRVRDEEPDEPVREHARWALARLANAGDPAV